MDQSDSIKVEGDSLQASGQGQWRYPQDTPSGKGPTNSSIKSATSL